MAHPPQSLCTLRARRRRRPRNTRSRAPATAYPDRSLTGRTTPAFLAHKQSILSLRDGWLRGACHRARIRATRWLAMTVSNSNAPNATLVRRKTIKQAVAAGALEVGLRAAAVRSARRMRAVPGFRRIIVAQSDAVGMTHHRRTLRAARPVLAGAIVARRECCAVRLRSREHVMAVRRMAAGGGDGALPPPPRPLGGVFWRVPLRGNL